MEIRRYLNGKPVTEGELSVLNLATPELQNAVRDARRRVVREEAATGSEPALSDPTRADG